MGALYYRDVSFCKLVKDAEAKTNCNQENIDKYYSDLKKGISPFGGLIPGEGMIPGGEPSQPDVTPNHQEEPIISGKMTDDIFVELSARTAYEAQKDPASWSESTSGWEALLKKYGVTDKDYSAYSAALEKDPQRAQAIAQKYMQRLQELQATGK